MNVDLVFTREPHRVRGWEQEQFTWFLRGPAGVIQFVAGPSSESMHTILLRYPSIAHFADDGWSWSATDLGYHSPRPRYTGQGVQDEHCPVLGGRCYYDGSGLEAGVLLERWLRAGQDDAVIRRAMTERYTEWLCSEDHEVFASVFTAFAAAFRDPS